MSEAQSPDAAPNYLEFAIDAIGVDDIKNMRTNLVGIDQLSESIHIEGLLQPPVVAVIFDRDADGNLQFDEDNQPKTKGIHLIAGFRRKAAIELLGTNTDEHNVRVSEDDWEGVEAEGYMFLDDDGAILKEEVAFEYDFLGCVVREVDTLDEDTLSHARRSNLIENLSREDLGIGDAIRGVNALLADGFTQTQVGNATSLSQPTVSNYRSVGTAIDAVLEAVDDGKIKLSTAVNISKMRTQAGKPNKRDQQNALSEAINGKEKGESVKKRRTPRELSELFHDLQTDGSFPEMDDERRGAIVDTLAWAFCMCDTDVLVDGLSDKINYDSELMPAKKEPKAAKEPKKAKAAKATKTPAKGTGTGRTRTSRTKKTDAKPAAAAKPAEGAAEEAPKRTRSKRTRTPRSPKA